MVFTKLVYYIKISFLFLAAQVFEFSRQIVFLAEVSLQEGNLIKPKFLCVKRQFSIQVFLCVSESGSKVQTNPLGNSCSMRF